MESNIDKALEVCQHLTKDEKLVLIRKLLLSIGLSAICANCLMHSPVHIHIANKHQMAIMLRAIAANIRKL
ncbi:hypothetical protein GTQ43_36785 [Nostoc sp. KVJ3]|uniref:hypothetical protein n=1 Tax=Nostoc sp. KVJ3 TaxID=457945 RepID=UPI002237DCFE|nr:hypothetical protein [Nostoc sp. KVJ3]MCW5318996.1 hypothetical protein [Nostoc sp. KVJ3]